jgi:hypothetical protein
MWARCRRETHPEYPNYGGRGIVVCDRWRSFEDFYADMGDRPTNKHSLDRINNDLGYSPENCRWTTRDVQNNNRSLRSHPSHCKYGHPFSPENTRIKPRPNGNFYQICKTCERRHWQEQRAQKRLARELEPAP